MRGLAASKLFLVVLYGLTIAVSAFLLFQVQPMIGKVILPWFGGGPSVWTASMLFFQVLLLGGYAYAHALSRMSAAKQARLHLIVLAVALAWLAVSALLNETPITPGARWKPAAGVFPVGQVLGVLLISVGVPYFLLSTTSSLAQAWFSRLQRERSPYAFYALSNAASLLALLSYPLLFEPFWTLRQQGWFWSLGFGVYLAFIAACAWLLLVNARRAADGLAAGAAEAPAVPPVEVEPSPPVESLASLPPQARGKNKKKGARAAAAASSAAAAASNAAAAASNAAAAASDLTDWLPQDEAPEPAQLIPAPDSRWGRLRARLDRANHHAQRFIDRLPRQALMRAYWAALAMTASVTLLATTNHMTQDIASMPFLWVVPLSLYLLSFVVVFDDRLVGQRWMYLPLTVGALYVGFHTLTNGSSLPIIDLILYNATLLFAICLLCHSELYARRPEPSQLTAFYLMMSVGGALGGVFVSLIAPLVFPDFWEFQLGLAAAALIVVIIAFTIPGRRIWLIPRVLVSVGALVMAGFILTTPLVWLNSTTYMSRNFYGVLRVRETVVDNMPGHILIHGGILHGMQVSGEGFRLTPTKYYSYSTGVGVAFGNHARRLDEQPLRVGAVGLGIGTVAAYGRPGDVFRFYEIDPQVIAIAQDARYFTYLSDSAAEIELVLGDARLSLERELAEGGGQGYDLLIVDAFSGDSIPTHLINREAVALYLRHLAPGGMIAFHISNRHIDLEPVTAQLAQEFGLSGKLLKGGGQDWQGTAATWALIAPDPAALESFGLNDQGFELRLDPEVRLWTDDYSNLFQVLR